MMNPSRQPIAEIYDRYQAGETVTALAEEYGVSRQRIHQLVGWEAHRRGQKLRERIFAGPPTKDVPKELLDSVASGELTMLTGARLASVDTITLRIRLREAGMKVNRYAKSRARNAEIYRKFMAGALLKELAEEYRTTVGNIEQKILRHRRRTGAPGKYKRMGA